MLKRPALLSWATVTISPSSVGTARLDSFARRGPVFEPRAASVVVRAQVDWTTEHGRERLGMAGASEEHAAILTIRRADADAANYTPRLGDHVTAITDRGGRSETASLYVTEARKSGAWASGFSTWLLRCTDRAPAHNGGL